MQKLKKKGGERGRKFLWIFDVVVLHCVVVKKFFLRVKLKNYIYISNICITSSKNWKKNIRRIFNDIQSYIYIYNWNKNFSALRRWKIIFALFFARIENIESSKRKKKKRIFRKNSLNLIGNRYFKGEKKILPFALMSRIRDKFITHERR